MKTKNKKQKKNKTKQKIKEQSKTKQNYSTILHNAINPRLHEPFFLNSVRI